MKSSIEGHIKNAERLARLMDSEFKIFNLRFGLDPLIGLVPGIGDTVSLVLGMYLIWIGAVYQIPSHALIRMIINLVFDFLIGAIPVLGDVSDFFYKSNLSNLKILKQYTQRIEEGEIVSS